MLTARQIAELVGGELRGDAAVTVDRVAPIDRAVEGQLTFLGVAKYAPLLATCGASVALVSPDLADTPGGVSARVVVERPHEAMLRVLPLLFVPAPRRIGIDATVRIGRGAVIGADVSIAPYVVIGDGAVIGDRVRLDAHVVVGDGVEIGEDAHCFPHVTIYAGTTLGKRVVAHAGVRLGSDGFGFVFTNGAHQKIPHVGRCIVEDDVEIGANTTIDRGSIDDTVIGSGSKIDNLVMIAHNVRVGRLCLVVAQAGIAGSARLGDGCVVGGQVGVQGHVHIGDGARLGGQAGVLGDVPAGETWSGYPARPHRESLRAQAALFKLGKLMRRLEKLVGDDAK
ncbi:MAG: UDP-3-O-(3-hydroxymyristoyl)glucosamine N-acyltransferase [Gemmatimonadota bacterium]